MLWETCVLASAILLIFSLFLKKRHPKGYPLGPTGIPLLGYKPWLGKDSHVNIGKLGLKYGNIFSIQLGSLSMVVLNNLETVKAAFKLETFSGRPNHLLVMSLYKLGIVFSTGKIWKEQRKFALRALRDMGFGKEFMEKIVDEEVADLISYFRSQLNQPIHFREVLAVSVVNPLWVILTGKRLSLNDPKCWELIRMAQEGVTDPDFSGLLYIFPGLASILPGKFGFARADECVEIMKVTIREIIVEHQKTFIPGSPRDYMDLHLEKMAETTDPNSGFFQQLGIDNLVDSVLSLFIGGEDPMASTMEFTFLYLLSNPEKYRRIQTELDTVVGRLRKPNLDDRPKMPYLEAVMQESMRMSSVAPGSVLHNTTEDVEFEGFNLPKGTIVMANLHQIHNNEDYWIDPHNFRPERFINEDGSFRKDENVIPFSIGKRICPGEKIAMVEYFLYLANILHTFDIQFDPNSPLPGLGARKPALVISPIPYKIVFREK